jgi:3-hydroxyisobutyrate dehydrogenase
MKTPVAILGLGIMGSGMARRLAASGFPLSVYSRNREKAAPFPELGAFVADSPREAAARANIVISMVSDDAASRAVWMGDDGALAGAPSGSVLIESSTLTVGWVKELAAAASERDREFLDAPVTGTKPHAESGQLLFLVGGSASAIEIARPVLSVLGRDIVHLGPTASGALMKLINNFMAAVQAVSFGEALALIQAGGLDVDKALAILGEGAPGSPMVKRVAARVSSGDFTPHFFLRLMTKDVAYAVEEAKSRGVPLPTAQAALSVFRQAQLDGHSEQDFTAVIQSLKPPK